MQETKHKTIPYKDTIEVKRIIGEKVLTQACKKIGKVKSIRIPPKNLTVEGILVDQGMFKVVETLNLKEEKALTSSDFSPVIM